jgi:hypothetical protein
VSCELTTKSLMLWYSEVGDREYPDWVVRL